MQIIFKGDVLELGDIVIFEGYQQYRNSGIGTMMFILLADFAREHNFIKIEGWMQPESIDEWPKLLKTPLKKGRLIEKDIVDAPQTFTISGVLWDETFKKA